MKGNAALDCGELRRMRTPLIYLDFLLNSARLVITLSQIPEYQQPANVLTLNAETVCLI